MRIIQDTVIGKTNLADAIKVFRANNPVMQTTSATQKVTELNSVGVEQELHRLVRHVLEENKKNIYVVPFEKTLLKTYKKAYGLEKLKGIQGFFFFGLY